MKYLSNPKFGRYSTVVDLKLSYEAVAHLARQGYSLWAIQRMYGSYRKMNRLDKWLKENNLSWSSDFKPLFKEEVIRLHKVGYTPLQMWREFFQRSNNGFTVAKSVKTLERIIRIYEEEVQKREQDIIDDENAKYVFEFERWLESIPTTKREKK